MCAKQEKGCNGPTGHSLETPDVEDFSFSDVISIPSASPQWRRVVVGWGCRQDSPNSASRRSGDPGNTHTFIMLYLLHQKDIVYYLSLSLTHTHTLKDYFKKICSNKDADIESRLVDTVGEGKGGRNWE